MKRARSRFAGVLVVLAVVVVGGVMGQGHPEADTRLHPPAAADRPSDATTPAPAEPEPSEPAPEPTEPDPEPTHSSAAGSHLVTHVVDGDTIDLADGERIRFVGIDTPERGQCGYEQASDLVERLVLGQRVRLTVSDEDRDGYGRLLRYVDVGATDVGLRLVQEGLATARYDSRDGYGFHPREDRYVQADGRAEDVQCGRAQPLVQKPAQHGCAPGYRPCLPPAPPDLDCADVDGPVKVTGTDPHRLDRDGDGVACE